MLEKRSWKGLWHDPRDPQATVAGDLTFSQEDAQLELIGRLPRFSNEPELPWATVERSRLCGVTTDGPAVTLERCIPRSARAGRGVPTESHHPDLILVGAHYGLDEKVVFDAIEFQFTHLDQWATVSGFNTSLNLKEDNNTLDSLAVTFTPPESVVVALDDRTVMSIDFSWTSSAIRQVTTESIIKQHAAITFRFRAPTEIYQAIAIGVQFRNFLNLAVGVAVHPRTIVGITGPSANAVTDAWTGQLPSVTRVELLYQLPDQPDQDALTTTRDPHEMLFTLGSVVDSLSARFGSWRRNYVRLKPTFDLFFAVNYGAMRYIDPQFLALVQALETYDRRTNGNVFPAWVPADERRRRREPTLTMRLQRIYELLGTVADRVAPDRDHFLATVVAGRNYYTHYDERLEARAPTGIALVPLTSQLKASVEALLLHEIEFSFDEIDAIFDRVDRYALIDHLQTVTAEHLTIPDS